MSTQKPAIESFYLGQKNVPWMLVDILSGAIGLPVPYGVNFTVDDINLVVISNMTVLTPTIVQGGVFLVPTSGDCMLTQHFLRVDGNQIVGGIAAGAGIGIPYGMANYNIRVRALLRPGAVLQWYVWCAAPTMGAGDTMYGVMVFTIHYFDPKILTHYTNYEIMQFVKNLGD